jgi:hypothetical protein
MILVILGRRARRPLGLVRREPGDCPLAVLEPSGLSVPGWAHHPEHPQDDRLVVDGEVHPVDRLTAVITALDAVAPFDLPDVRARDRSFVATEMTAFLRCWLLGLSCLVIDPPSPVALSGSAADRAVWSRAAAELAVPDLQAAPVPRTRTRAVTVIAGRVVGPGPEPAAATALSLARAAGVTAARLTLTDDAREPGLCEAIPWWYTPSPAALRAMVTYAREMT